MRLRCSAPAQKNKNVSTASSRTRTCWKSPILHHLLRMNVREDGSGLVQKETKSSEDDVAHGKERTLDISKIGMSEILVLEERNRIPFWIGRRSESEGKRDARYDVEKCVKSSVS